jgi:glycosyltransferase involved in cell wall biosynthesis
MEKITFVVKGPLDSAVPIISVAQAFKAIGFEVKMICGDVGIGLRTNLENKGISIDNVGVPDSKRTGLFGIFDKAIAWLSFRKRASKRLSDSQFDYLYIGTADTAIALRGIFETKYKYLLHLRELYDRFPHYMFLLKYPARNSIKIIVPEENRAYLYYSFLKLRSLPVTIPNKPMEHPRGKKLDIGFLDLGIQEELKQRKNIIYQGHLHPERDLRVFLKAMANLEDFNVILMGNDQGMLGIYKQILPQLIHIPFVSPPRHLNVTSWADIGIVTYDLKSLNTIYCAPNKTWEYAGFGIPILANENPGLRYTLMPFKCGEIIDFEDSEMIIAGINRIIENLDLYSKNSESFFDSFDFREKVKSLIP